MKNRVSHFPAHAARAARRVPILIGRAAAFAHSLRFRLAVWFLFVLSLVLLGFSLFVYYRTAQDVRDYTAARLVVRLREINAVVTGRYHDAGWDWWRGSKNAQEEEFALRENEVILISTSDGAVMGAWGGLPDALANQVSTQAVQGITSARKKSYGQASSAAQPAGGSFFEVDLPLDSRSPARTKYLFNPAPVLLEGRQVGWVIIGLPLDPDHQMARLAVTLALAGAATLLAALGGGYWLASRALWPVQAITRTAQEISETDLNRRLNICTRDELGELAATFDHMLDRLQVAFQRQRQFTADASHELRTPLSIISLETSRALAGQRTVEEYQAALRVIDLENQMMTRLVEELLLLARMDAGHTRLRHEPIDLSELAVDLLERYAPAAASRGIHLEAVSLPEAPVSGDRHLLGQAVGNLLDNAIKYHHHERHNPLWVRVETGLSSTAERPGAAPHAWVRVSDNGPGIAAEHLPRLFDRFYRVDDARSRSSQEDEEESGAAGSGLGLSIVQWIVQAHDGQVSVESCPGEGSAFTIFLPVFEQDLNPF